MVVVMVLLLLFFCSVFVTVVVVVILVSFFCWSSFASAGVVIWALCVYVAKYGNWNNVVQNCLRATKWTALWLLLQQKNEAAASTNVQLLENWFVVRIIPVHISLSISCSSPAFLLSQLVQTHTIFGVTLSLTA